MYKKPMRRRLTNPLPKIIRRLKKMSDRLKFRRKKQALLPKKNNNGGGIF